MSFKNCNLLYNGNTTTKTAPRLFLNFIRRKKHFSILKVLSLSPPKLILFIKNNYVTSLKIILCTTFINIIIKKKRGAQRN